MIKRLVLPEMQHPSSKEQLSRDARCFLPYADCFAAALTTTRQAPLATSDKDFTKLHRHLAILWTT